MVVGGDTNTGRYLPFLTTTNKRLGMSNSPRVRAHEIGVLDSEGKPRIGLVIEWLVDFMRGG
jgi:hypothetical protein